MTKPQRAVVVGSGPNGLAGAIRLARAGVAVTLIEQAPDIGGGCRSSHRTLPGLIHDDCAAFHPTAQASPFLRSLPLERFGLQWCWPEIDLAHPLDSAPAGLLWRDIDRTAAHLGPDGAAWTRLIGPHSRHLDALATHLFGPAVAWPAHPWRSVAFGRAAALPAAWTARRLRTPQAQALFAGAAAHAITDLRAPLTSAVGLVLLAASHAHGWPVARGGSGALTRAMGDLLVSLGGEIITNTRVSSLNDLAHLNASIVLLDTSPQAALALTEGRMPRRIAQAYTQYRHGPGAFKVDLAIEGPIPWTDPDCGRAGTLHLGGDLAEVLATEAATARGQMPARPFVLVGQQYLADPSRSMNGVHPVWAYAHVPHGYPGDATEAVLNQIERFAPGVRSQIRAVATRSPAELEAYNPNYVGGDIATGASGPLQILRRPRLARNPYATGIPGVYLCSAATPPGPGVHGMGGYHAATRALRSAAH